jgi:hypothetical protein
MEWASAGARTALDAVLLTASYFPGAPEGQNSHQGTIGTQVAAPEILVKYRKQNQSPQHPHYQKGHAGEKEKHFYIGDGPVGTVQEAAQGTGRHLQEGDADKKVQQKVFSCPKGAIQVGPDPPVPAEGALPTPPQPFGDGSHRANEGTERFLSHEAHGQKGDKQDKSCWVKGMNNASADPVAEAYEGTDGKKAFNRWRPADGRHAALTKTADKQPEPDPGQQAPEEKAPLDGRPEEGSPPGSG